MFVILLGAWLGASLGGADWTSNTMTTLLTWEPRRVRVFVTRAVVVAVVVMAIIAFLQVVFAGLYDARRPDAGYDGVHPVRICGRTRGQRHCASAVVAAAFGLIAYAIAMIGRSTVAALGVLFGYLVLVEGVIVGIPALDRGEAAGAGGNGDRQPATPSSTTRTAAPSTARIPSQRSCSAWLAR